MEKRYEATTVQQPDGTAAGRKSTTVRREWILRTLRRLEPAVGWSVGGCTAWLAATSYPHLPGLWMFALTAVLVGVWAQVRGAVYQAEMAGRAMALIAAAFLLHTQTGTQAAPDGAFFFWLTLPALYGALMLRPSWAACVAAAAVLGFMAASLLGSSETLASVSARAAFLLVLPLLLAMKLGAAMRRPPAADDGHIDHSTSLYNRSGLLSHGKELLEGCRRERRELSLVVFDCSDLLEVRQIYGTGTSRKLIQRFVRSLTVLAGERGLAARTGPAQFTIALPLGREKALQAIHRVLGSPVRIELEAGNSEIVLVPDFMVEAVPESGSVGKMYMALCRGLCRVQEEEQRRQSYLKRERERHSRPMSLQPVPAPQAAPAVPMPRLGAAPDMPQIPPTIPMPLSGR